MTVLLLTVDEIRQAGRVNHRCGVVGLGRRKRQPLVSCFPTSDTVPALSIKQFCCLDFFFLLSALWAACSLQMSNGGTLNDDGIIYRRQGALPAHSFDRRRIQKHDSV